MTNEQIKNPQDQDMRAKAEAALKELAHVELDIKISQMKSKALRKETERLKKLRARRKAGIQE